MVSSPIRPELAESAARISQAMAAKGLRLIDVAQALGMTDKYGSSVHNWVRGRNAPTPRYRQPLADLLGLDAADLVPPHWDATPGMKAANAMSANIEARRAIDARRTRDREQKRAKRALKFAQAEAETEPFALLGPAERALLHGKAIEAPPRDKPGVEVLSTSLRADGTMRLKLDLTVSAEQGMRLVTLLHEVMIAKGDSRDGEPT